MVGVVAETAPHQVGAEAAVDDVGILVAGDGVGQGVARAHQRATQQRQALDIRRQRVVDAAVDQVIAFVERLGHHIVFRVDEVGVVLGATLHEVAAALAVQDVIARAADQMVGIVSTRQVVVAGLALEVDRRGGIGHIRDHGVVRGVGDDAVDHHSAGGRAVDPLDGVVEGARDARRQDDQAAVNQAHGQAGGAGDTDHARLAVLRRELVVEQQDGSIDRRGDPLGDLQDIVPRIGNGVVDHAQGDRAIGELEHLHTDQLVRAVR